MTPFYPYACPLSFAISQKNRTCRAFFYDNVSEKFAIISVSNCQHLGVSYMITEMGEYIVGAYLKIILDCDFVDYNARAIEGGKKGLGEFDVIGLRFEDKAAYICEVTTHIRGLLYKNNKSTVDRIKQKYARQKEYAKDYLRGFPKRRYMFWSPFVHEGYVTDELKKIKGLQLVINKKYTKCVDELREQARIMFNDTGNPFFRFLQILERLR